MAAASDVAPPDAVGQPLSSAVGDDEGGLPRTLWELFAPRRSRALALLRPDPIVVLCASGGGSRENYIREGLDCGFRWCSKRRNIRNPGVRYSTVGDWHGFGAKAGIVELSIIVGVGPPGSCARPWWGDDYKSARDGHVVLFMSPKIGEISTASLNAQLASKPYNPQSGMQNKSLRAPLVDVEEDPSRWVIPHTAVTQELSTLRSEEIARAVFEWLTPGHEWFRTRALAWNRNDEGTANLELDGFAPELASAFEYNGAQHRIIVPRFHPNGQADLDAQRRRDARKRLNCENSGVRLFEVSDEEANTRTPLAAWFALVRPMAEEALGRRGLPNAALRG